MTSLVKCSWWGGRAHPWKSRKNLQHQIMKLCWQKDFNSYVSSCLCLLWSSAGTWVSGSRFHNRVLMFPQNQADTNPWNTIWMEKGYVYLALFLPFACNKCCFHIRRIKTTLQFMHLVCKCHQILLSGFTYPFFPFFAFDFCGEELI